MTEQFGTTKVAEFDVEASVLCLSFANTADWHASDAPVELLKSYDDLLTWGQALGVLHEERAGQLASLAAEEAEAASHVLRQAVALREALFRLFSAADAGRPLPGPDLDVVNGLIPDALTHLRLVGAPEGAQWEWEDKADALDQVLWPVLYSAGQVLTTDALEQVGRCDDDRGCGWLFLDTSRNHSRRWCSMDRCGNRAKAKRHYRRTKAQAGRS